MSSAPNPDSMVLLDDVRLTLASDAGDVNVLRGISLAVAPGETVSVVGPSGSGKSTMLMIVGGLERPSSGRIVVAGSDLNAMNEDALARFRRDRIGIVFQSFHLVPTMNAVENVAIPLELAGRRDAFARAEAGLAAVGLGHRLLHYPGQLSGGEQQRVALARALLLKPAWLFLDEATASLDPEAEARFYRLLKERLPGTAIISIAHRPAVAQYHERALRVRDGRLVVAAPAV